MREEAKQSKKDREAYMAWQEQEYENAKRQHEETKRRMMAHRAATAKRFRQYQGPVGMGRFAAPTGKFNPPLRRGY
jgi:hypothetical protein